jgi:hypothetical protein
MKRQLLALLLFLPAASAIDDREALRLDAQITWTSREKRFGGFSGLAIRDGGTRLLAISDRGSWATGELHRDRNGNLRSARLTAIGPIHAISGAALTGRNTDAEDLAIAPDGAAYVSFEHFHRVRRYRDINGAAEDVVRDPGFSRLQGNSGLEALTFDAEGTLYAIPERSGEWTRPFPVYRLRDGVWDTDLEIRRDGRFLVTGADFGPDGRLYIVERDFRFFGGFAARIRSFRLGPDGFDDERLLLESHLGDGTLDNMEGISVWRASTGTIRITLISDDNFNMLQKTILAEYVLSDG